MREPIRVLMVNYKMQCAGIESFIMNMYRNIDRSKVQFDFLVHYKEKQFYDDEIERLGGKIYRLSVREDNNLIKYLRDLKVFFNEHHEYHIVHGHMESFGVFYFRAAMKGGIPVRIAHSHIAEKNRGIKGAIKGILNRGFSKYATDLLACSDAAGVFLFGNNARYHVFNNAIETDRFVFDKEIRNIMRNKYQIDNETLVIGHVGRFNEQKNHLFLIDVFDIISKKNNKAVLILIGEGNLENRIRKKVESLNLCSKVFFMGVRKDVSDLYQMMDVFVMPSLFEGLPISGIEAQASGLKCLFSDSITQQVAITENVEFMSLDKSAEEWADRILQYNYEYNRLGIKNKIVSAGYDIKNQAVALMKYYQSTLRNL